MHTTATDIDADGRITGSCSCGYACIGGDLTDVQSNLDAHLTGGVV